MVGDAATAFVIADVGEEVDAAAEARQPDGDVQRAAADVFANDLTVSLDDVDQGFADDQRAIGVHVSTPARSGPRSYLAAILTRARLREFMSRLPLAPVLARTSLRSSLALVFGNSCRLLSH